MNGLHRGSGDDSGKNNGMKLWSTSSSVRDGMVMTMMRVHCLHRCRL